MNWIYWQHKLVFVLWLAYTLWWLFINFIIPDNSVQGELWGGTHGLAALLGATIGLINARAWGGMKSLVGKAMIVFSFGLLCQLFGQIIFAYYVSFGHVELPYPSLADFGYFGTIPFYIYGAYLLAKWSGATKLFCWREQGVFLVGLVLSVLLIISAPMFYYGYIIHRLSLLGVLFSYLYILSNTIFVFLSVAPYFSLCRTVRWSIYRPVLFFSVALIFQYIADYVFFIQVNYLPVIPGSIIDYFYFFAYCLMAIGLIRFRVLVESIQRVVGFNETRPYFAWPGYLRLKKLGILFSRYVWW